MNSQKHYRPGKHPKPRRISRAELTVNRVKQAMLNYNPLMHQRHEDRLDVVRDFVDTVMTKAVTSPLGAFPTV